MTVKLWVYIRITWRVYGIWMAEPHPRSFKSAVGPENLHVQQVPRWHWWCWFCKPHLVQFRSVQWLGRVRLFATPWTAARQASLSITNSWSLLKPMSTESVMPSNHLILCRPLLLPPSNHTSRTTVMVHSVEQQVLSGRKRNAAKNLRKGTGLEARRASFLACSLTSHCLALASSWFLLSHL